MLADYFQREQITEEGAIYQQVCQDDVMLWADSLRPHTGLSIVWLIVFSITCTHHTTDYR